MKLIIYTDGASRGNPGPAGAGFAIYNEKGEVVKKYSQYLGKATNNEAEYGAVILALKKIKLLFGKEKVKSLAVEICSDSQLLVKQLSGEYKIKDEKIKDFFIEIWNLKIDFGLVCFKSIPREKNNLADSLANEAIDSQAKNKSLF